LEAAHDKMVHLRELLPIQYIIYGVEKGEKGTPHFQGYIELQKRVAFDVVKRAINNSHIESRRGSQQQAIEYCKKKGTFTNGEVPRIKAIVRIYNLLNVLWSLIVLLRLY